MIPQRSRGPQPKKDTNAGTPEKLAKKTRNSTCAARKTHLSRFLRRLLHPRLILFWIVAVWPVGGCRPPSTPYPASLQSERPEERVLAIKHAAVIQDQDVIGILVDRLEDEDEAVRFYAILALDRLTGTRLGYSYHARETERARAVTRWRRYLTEPEPASGRTCEPASGRMCEPASGRTCEPASGRTCEPASGQTPGGPNP